MHVILSFTASWWLFFRWKIQVHPHFWPWHACLNQALLERSDPQSERTDAYSLARRNYQERLEPLIPWINCQAWKKGYKNAYGKHGFPWQGLSFSENGEDLLFAFINSHTSLMLSLNTSMLRALTAAFLQMLMGCSGWTQAIGRCIALWWMGLLDWKVENKVPMLG